MGGGGQLPPLAHFQLRPCYFLYIQATKYIFLIYQFKNQYCDKFSGRSFCIWRATCMVYFSSKLYASNLFAL